MRLIKPTKQSIKQFYRIYKSDANGFGELYKAALKLVEIYPSHTKYSHVLSKSVVINHLFSTNIRAIKQMSKHVSESHVGALINRGSLQAVDTISKDHGIKSSRTDKEYEFYSFATKYCHCHNSKKFPIYDRYVDYVLWQYQTSHRFSDFKRNQLREYKIFVQVLDDFKQHYKLGNLSPNILDKFLWLQGKKFLELKNDA